MEYKHFEKDVETFGTKAEFENFLEFNESEGDYTQKEGSLTIYWDRTGIKLGQYDNKESVGLSFI